MDWDAFWTILAFCYGTAFCIIAPPCLGAWLHNHFKKSNG